MPPKPKPSAGAGPSKKTEQKKKEKVIEDKTFGLKNKKGAKQQKFIQQVEKQVKTGGLHPAIPVDAKKLEKEKKLKDQKELAMLFKPVQIQKIEKGADPKSIVCAFFKQGQCTKGDRCKFSHDLTIERKAEKRSLYCDMRDDGDTEDTMENWDEAKLMEVIDKKHGADKRMPNTDIICKYFLEAVERSKYGWFWTCPTGESCIYRHALPPGFVLKRDKAKQADKRNEISLEDLIEKERAALGPKQTRITLESFNAWKKRKIQEKYDTAIKDEEKKRTDYKAGRQVGLSGREMFSFNPELAADNDMEDGDEAFDNYARSEDEDEIVYKELQLDMLGFEAQEVDGSGTLATEDRFKTEPTTNGTTPIENGTSSSATEVPINENLFLEDDLDAIDDELQDLDLEE